MCTSPPLPKEENIIDTNETCPRHLGNKKTKTEIHLRSVFRTGDGNPLLFLHEFKYDILVLGMEVLGYSNVDLVSTPTGMTAARTSAVLRTPIAGRVYVRRLVLRRYVARTLGKLRGGENSLRFEPTPVA